MIFTSDERLKHFYNPSPRLWTKLCIATVSFTLAIFGALQTKTALALFSKPTPESIRIHMTRSRELQEKLHSRSDPYKGIRIEGVFPKRLEAMVQKTIESLLSDFELQRQLQSSYGLSFKDLDVRILPTWEASKLSSDELELTSSGIWALAEGSGEPFANGLTIRDRPESQMTLDGIPKIYLSAGAFASERVLRLTLFHHLLHALNIPGYLPTQFVFLQSDLAYLPEYRSYVKQYQLDGINDLVIIGIVLVSVAIFAIEIMAVFRIIRSRVLGRKHITPAQA